MVFATAGGPVTRLKQLASLVMKKSDWSALNLTHKMLALSNDSIGWFLQMDM